MTGENATCDVRAITVTVCPGGVKAPKMLSPAAKLTCGVHKPLRNLSRILADKFLTESKIVARFLVWGIGGYFRGAMVLKMILEVLKKATIFKKWYANFMKCLLNAVLSEFFAKLHTTSLCKINIFRSNWHRLD